MSRFRVTMRDTQRAAGKWELRKAIRRLELWGHKVLRIGANGIHWTVDGEMVDQNRLVFLSKDV
jgi:hypothetical protein